MNKCGLIIGLIVIISIPFTELYIGFLEWNNTSCIDAILLAPVIWLVISGLLFFIVLTLVSILYVCGDIGFILSVLLTILYLCFSICWAIIGGIILWRDNLDCSTASIQIIMFAAFLYHITIVMILSSILIKNRR